MKFICITEPYRHFRGWLFAYGKPTDVTDRATIAALERHPDFMRVDEKPSEEGLEEGATTPLPDPVASSLGDPGKPKIPDICPKCGKTVKRGKFMHQRFCRGKK